MKYEKEILNSVENSEWKSVKDKNLRIKCYMQYAKETLKKDKRLNIRLSTHDLEGIQRLAIGEGIPYQTLITSIIHKYVSNH